jgi:hypothetical protein
VVPAQAPPAVVPPSTPHSPAGPERRDLSLNVAGDTLREMADELKRERMSKGFFARLFATRSEERAYRVGSAGEVIVGRHLSQLGPDWRVLHSVPAGRTGRDIDHLVIGPGGVFSLNTKHHRGKKVWVAERTFMINGHRTDYLPKSHKEGAQASKVLSRACRFPLTVEPVIAVIAADVKVKAEPRDVHVVRAQRIAKWLAARPPVLTPEGVQIVFEEARWSTTWRHRTNEL